MLPVHPTRPPHHHRSLLAACSFVSTGLPAHTHRAFLLKLTDDICNASPGSLSFQTCKDSHTLMKGWAEAPEKLQNTQFSGKERAMAVEANDE